MRVLYKGYYFVHDGVFGFLGKLSGLAPLLMRLYLAPVMIAAGMYKLQNLESTTAWFDTGLGLPYPEVMALLASYSELIGGFLLLFGLAVRWASVPLMVAMLVAIFAVHWENGWFAIAPSQPATSAAKPVAALGIPAAKESLNNSVEVGRRLEMGRSLLKEHGHYDWLTEKGSFVILNNGIEFAATYFIMLLSLFFSGGGRWFSVDYCLDKRGRAALKRKPEPATS
ncbi:DoxX protein [Spongiibacter sp. IMCC21906]|uniref:HvfX family Cu-binding RiPP maturation protein n=1 Tax=Spongiibacter sp. IMCC21906 TaxID=1620392 RepID=UPI00062DD809|nr:DoxX family protein [Spongiibacter sp. IMCC21906]AKH70789.1 DoxX protein [Spongiibacter sp. IMCC21906]